MSLTAQRLPKSGNADSNFIDRDKLGRIRLASDLRFYEEGAAIDKRWMKLFKHGDGL